MSDPSNPLDWVDKAEGDLRVALASIRGKRPVTFAACFHAQQCVEKYMKAMLVLRQRPFSKVHDLIAVNDELTAAGILIAVSEDDLSTLSHYAVPARYPGEDPTVDDARQQSKSRKLFANLRASF